MAYVAMRDGQALHVRVTGRGQPVLVLPGLGMTSRQWLPFVAPYRRDFRFYMVDFRGAGRSSQSQFNQPDIFQNNMEDVQDVVRHFGLEDLLLVGYSMGASTALHWLREDGFRGVRRYLHMDQSACITNRDDWTYGLYGARQAILTAAFGELRGFLAPYRHLPGLVELPPAARQTAMAIMARMYRDLGAGSTRQHLLTAAGRWPRLLRLLFPNPSMTNTHAYLSSYTNAHDYRDSVRACEVPMTFMVGMHSELYDARGQLAVAQLPRHGRVVRFEKSGHLLVLREPLKFRRELGHFLHDRR